jgi:transposase
MPRSIGAGLSSWRAPGAASTSWRASSSPRPNAIREWVKPAALDEGLRSNGLTTTEREELTRLRRENRMLREEREILAKAAAWFAQETATTPRRSHS